MRVPQGSLEDEQRDSVGRGKEVVLCTRMSDKLQSLYNCHSEATFLSDASDITKDHNDIKVHFRAFFSNPEGLREAKLVLNNGMDESRSIHVHGWDSLCLNLQR